MPDATSPTAVSPSQCPLCGRGNQCGVQAARDAGRSMDTVQCWCMAVQVPASLRARLPAEARGRTCICADCVAAARDPKVA